MIPAIVYALCALTSIICAVLLLRMYRRRLSKLLLWSSSAFALFAINNVLLFVDLTVVTVDLSLARGTCSLAAVLVLLYGLITETPS